MVTQINNPMREATILLMLHNSFMFDCLKRWPENTAEFSLPISIQQLPGAATRPVDQDFRLFAHDGKYMKRSFQVGALKDSPCLPHLSY